jgi:hypothetical protein
MAHHQRHPGRLRRAGFAGRTTLPKIGRSPIGAASRAHWETDVILRAC